LMIRTFVYIIGYIPKFRYYIKDNLITIRVYVNK